MTFINDGIWFGVGIIWFLLFVLLDEERERALEELRLHWWVRGFNEAVEMLRRVEED